MSRHDGSNEGSQCMFLLRNKKKIDLNYPQYLLLSGALTDPKCLNYNLLSL